MNKKEFLALYANSTPEELYGFVQQDQGKLEVEVYDEFDKKLGEMRNFMIAQVDKLLVAETEKYLKSLINNDTDQIQEIRQHAKDIVLHGKEV